MRVILELLECSKGLNFAFLHYNDFVGQMKEVDCVSDKDTRLLVNHTLEYLLENFLAHVSIKGRNWIVHNVDI